MRCKRNMGQNSRFGEICIEFGFAFYGFADCFYSFELAFEIG